METETKIREALQRAEAMPDGKLFGMTFEQGLVAALLFVLGDGDDPTDEEG